MQICNNRSYFYQWDLNQKITSDAFKIGDEIHFVNKSCSVALVVAAYELNGQIVADVPNILLQEYHPIIVYRYVANGDMGSTVEQCKFKVEKRAKPDDYAYTETELYTIKTAINVALEEAKASGDFKGEPGQDGVGVRSMVVNQYGELVVTYTDGSYINLGYIVGPKGDNGSDGKDGIGITTTQINENGELVVYYSDNTSQNLGMVVGEAGKDGNDYILTEADKQEIASMVDGSDVDLTDYVKNTDYANSEKAGVVKISSGNGISISDTGLISIRYANKSMIDGKQAYYMPIVPQYLDYAVKSSITTNTETLTEEEKANVCEWLGVNTLAIPNVVSGGNKHLSVNDVSPLAHKCSCRLTSDKKVSESIMRFNGGNVSIQAFAGTSELECYIDDDEGTITLNGYSNARMSLCVYLYAHELVDGQEYTFTLIGDGKCGDEGIYKFEVLTDQGPYGSQPEYNKKITFVYSESMGHIQIYNTMWGNFEEMHEPFKNFVLTPVLEEGKGGSGDEPIITDFSTVKVVVGDKSYTPTEDGIVEGIDSVSPTMVITTDNSNANIVDFTYCIDTKKYIDDKVTTADFIVIVDALPEVGEANKFYLVPKSDSQTQDLFDEYIWINGKWEWITTKQVEVNLDNYLQKNTTTDQWGYNRIYAVDGKGNQIFLNAMAGQGANRIQITDGYGCLAVAEPRATNHAASKQYVDNTITNSLSKLLISNVIEGGDKTILISDASSVTHNCSCRLTSDTYEETQSSGDSNNMYEFSAENMTVGMYRLDGPSPVPYVINDNGTITFNGETDASGLSVGIKFRFYNLIPGQTYTFSLRSNQDEYLHADVLTANDWSSSVWEYDMTANNGDTLTITFTVTDADGHHWCDISCCGAMDWDSEGMPIQRPIENLILYPQLEFGDIMTDWSPYGGGGGIVVVKPYVEDFSTVRVNVSGKSYTPSVDGVVSNITSVAPIMEITTNNEHVNIHDITYYIDTKTYVDNNSVDADFISIVDTLPEVGESNKIYLVPKAESQTQDLFDEYLWINGEWEWITTKQVEVNLDEYMKKPTTQQTLDCVLAKRTGTNENIWAKVDAGNGLALLANGNLIVSGASNSIIDSKQTSAKPITPKHLDYAVKVGLTTNKETLTDEEKLAAMEWLGIKQYIDDAIAALKAELQGS